MSQQEAGWYHAEGDPAGSMRYWDGSQWVGEPTQTANGGATATVNSDPVGYWKLGWQRWNDFSGRSRRAEYWWFTLINFVISIVLNVLSAIDGIGVVFGLAALVFGIAGIVPAIAAAIRRLHDTGKSGWFLLIAFLPLIGAIVLLVFFFSDSHRGANQYGGSPKYG